LGPAVWRNGMPQLQLFFPPPVVPRCKLQYSFVLFLFYQLPASHVEIPRAGAGPYDGRARAASFDLVPPLRPVDPSPSFDIVNICANLASTSRDSLQSSILMPNILSQSTLSPAKNTFPSLPVSSDISEFKSFESSPTSKIRPGICPSILSPL
jgi:hypothetical protein